MASVKIKAVDYPEEDALNIYTDGSMLPGPRRGGTGVIFILINEAGNEEEVPYLPGYIGATNNQMEIRAPIEALKLALGRHPPFNPRRYRKIIIFTDSQYVANYYKTAMFTWSSNGWVKKDGAPVDNAADWKELVGLIRKAGNARKRVEIRWVKGKKTVRGKAVDREAKFGGVGARPPAPAVRGTPQTLEAPTRTGLGADGRSAADDPDHQVRSSEDPRPRKILVRGALKEESVP